MIVYDNGGPTVDFTVQLATEDFRATLGRTDKGYMVTDLFVAALDYWAEQMKTQFGITDRVILIVDGHASHVNYKVAQWALDHKWEIITLPSHCTHRMQPMDVSYFNKFRSLYHEISNQLNENEPVYSSSGDDLSSFLRDNTQAQVSLAILQASRYMSQGLISDGFKATGIWPLNRHKVRCASLMY